MGGIVDSIIKPIFGGKTKSEKAAEKAGKTATKAQEEALAYLKESEALPRELREGALEVFAGLAGLPGYESSQADMLTAARESPIYEAIKGTQAAGEDAILRSAAATGGLRSGNVQEALADQAQQIENQAILTAYNQQLAPLNTLVGLPSMSGQVAQQIGNVGSTAAQAITGRAQAQQDAFSGAFGGLGNIAGGIIGAGGIGNVAGLLGFSDRRLKKDIALIGYSQGLPVYSYTWNAKAHEMGLEGESIGFMSDEVATKYPDKVMDINGYQAIKYAEILEAA